MKSNYLPESQISTLFFLTFSDLTDYSYLIWCNPECMDVHRILSCDEYRQAFSEMVGFSESGRSGRLCLSRLASG